MVSVLDCDIELQSRYYINFRINTFGKGMDPLIPQLLVINFDYVGVSEVNVFMLFMVSDYLMFSFWYLK